MTNMFYRISDPQYGVENNSYILVIKLIGENTNIVVAKITNNVATPIQLGLFYDNISFKTC